MTILLCVTNEDNQSLCKLFHCSVKLPSVDVLPFLTLAPSSVNSSNKLAQLSMDYQYLKSEERVT